MSTESISVVGDAFATMDDDEQAYVKKTLLVNRLLFLGIGAGIAAIIVLVAWLVGRGKKGY